MPIFAALTRRMDWLSERQRVLAQNIANADTPGYRPHDLKPLSFRELVSTAGGEGNNGKLAPTLTHATHQVGGKVAAKGNYRDEVQRKSYETSPSGNAVVLEEQMVKLAETELEFSAATNLYRKNLGILKAAIGRRSG